MKTLLWWELIRLRRVGVARWMSVVWCLLILTDLLPDSPPDHVMQSSLWFLAMGTSFYWSRFGTFSDTRYLLTRPISARRVLAARFLAPLLCYGTIIAATGGLRAVLKGEARIKVWTFEEAARYEAELGPLDFERAEDRRDYERWKSEKSVHPGFKEPVARQREFSFPGGLVLMMVTAIWGLALGSTLSIRPNVPKTGRVGRPSLARLMLPWWVLIGSLALLPSKHQLLWVHIHAVPFFGAALVVLVGYAWKCARAWQREDPIYF